METHQLVNTKSLQVVSFNLHGFDKGSAAVSELILTTLQILFCFQEHWLTPNNMNKLDKLYGCITLYDNAVGSSAVVAAVSVGELRGRPYGWVSASARMCRSLL